MMEHLQEIIAKAYSDEVAEEWRDFRPSKDELRQLAELGRKVLLGFPQMPGACGPMSALFASLWNTTHDRPRVYVVAGAFLAGEAQIFGREIETDTIQDQIENSNPSWDGHFWIMLGNYIADVSIFRTAYSDYSPSALAHHINENCGSNGGLLISDELGVREIGLRYVPYAVLTDQLIETYTRAAQQLLER